MSSVELDFKLETKRATQELRNLNSSVQKVGDQVSLTRLSIANAFGAAIVGTIKSAASAIANSIGTIANKTIELEKLTTQFEVLTGSAEDAQKMMKDLQDFAAATPFQLPGLAKVSSQLLAFGFRQEEIIPKLKLLGDVAAASGTDLADIGLIFGQISAAGKLTGERLLQLQERGIPIGPALAQTLGVAETAVKSMVSKGKVDFATFEKAFASLNKQGGFAFEGMVKQSKTLGGVLSTLGDNFSLLQTDIGQQFLPTVKEIGIGIIGLIQANRELIKGLASLAADALKNVIDKFIAFGQHLSENAAVYKPIVVGLGAVGVALVAIAAKSAIATVSFSTLAASATTAWIAITGPIGLTVIAIGAVSAAAYALWANWDQVATWMRVKTLELAAAFADFGAFVLESIAPIEPGFRILGASIIRLWAHTTGTIIQGAFDLANSLGSLFGIELPDSLKNFKDNLLESATAMENGGGSANNLASSLRTKAIALREAAAATTVETETIKENTKVTNEAQIAKDEAAAREAARAKKAAAEALAREQKFQDELKGIKEEYALLEEEERLVKEEEKTVRDEEKLNNLIAILAREQEIKLQAAANLGAGEAELETLRTKNQIAQSKLRLKYYADENNQRRKIQDKQAKQFEFTEKAKVKWDQGTWNDRANQTRAGLNALAGLQSSSNKQAAAVGRAAAIVNATVQTYQAATGAFASLAGIPIVGPALGAAAAAAAVVAGLANVAKIKSTKPPAFADGGVVPGNLTSGDNVPAFLNSNEVVLNGRQQANTLFQVANNAPGEGGGMIAAINALGDRIMNMEIIVQASDYEIGRSVNRSIGDGLVLQSA